MYTIKSYVTGMVIGCDARLQWTYWWEFGKRQRIKQYRQACLDILEEIKNVEG